MKNKEMENIKLIKLINETIKKPNIENQYNMINLAIKSEFITPVHIEGNIKENNIVKIELEKNRKINFHMIEDSNKTYLMAFTGIEELQKWNETYKGEIIKLSFKEYLNMVKIDSKNLNGFVINPFSSNLIFDREILEEIDKQLKY